MRDDRVAELLRVDLWRGIALDGRSCIGTKFSMLGWVEDDPLLGIGIFDFSDEIRFRRLEVGFRWTLLSSEKKLRLSLGS